MGLACPRQWNFWGPGGGHLRELHQFWLLRLRFAHDRPITQLDWMARVALSGFRRELHGLSHYVIPNSVSKRMPLVML